MLRQRGVAVTDELLQRQYGAALDLREPEPLQFVLAEVSPAARGAGEPVRDALAPQDGAEQLGLRCRELAPERNS
ncbi:hypothetical protein BE15_30410 [Sorangium cellulosum]|uniref:Uncharacterized protein n=1 Tax=Sorangium cellulosum TaxID=56 RepID=A0A150QT48_SORCE|nr:hypothetical protein BE15_30410 [Sorangium cellulosum]